MEDGAILRATSATAIQDTKQTTCRAEATNPDSEGSLSVVGGRSSARALLGHSPSLATSHGLVANQASMAGKTRGKPGGTEGRGFGGTNCDAREHLVDRR
jgi:hypothetical protein